MAGKNAKCSKCNAIFKVPTAGVTQQPKPVTPPSRPAQQAAQPRGSATPATVRKKKSGMLWPVLIGAAVLLFCCLPGLAISGFFLLPMLWVKSDPLANLKIEKKPDDQVEVKPPAKRIENKKKGAVTPPAKETRQAPTSWSTTLAEGQSETIMIQFGNGRPAVIDVAVNGIGGPRPPVELVVTDTNGQVVAGDGMDGSARFATFFPPSTQSYSVLLRNAGPGAAQCALNAR